MSGYDRHRGKLEFITTVSREWGVLVNDIEQKKKFSGKGNVITQLSIFVVLQDMNVVTEMSQRSVRSIPETQQIGEPCLSLQNLYSLC